MQVHTSPCPDLIVDLLTVLQRGGQQGQQAVGAGLQVSAQVGQSLFTPRLDVGQGPTGALAGEGGTQSYTHIKVCQSTD